MFSGVTEGVFEPILTVEYTDNESSLGSEDEGEGGKVVKEKVSDGTYRVQGYFVPFIFLYYFIYIYY